MGRRRVTLAHEMCRWLPAGQGPPGQQWTPRNTIARRQERPARASPLFNLDTRKPPTVNSLEDILEHLRQAVLPRSRAQHRVFPPGPRLAEDPTLGAQGCQQRGDCLVAAKAFPQEVKGLPRPGPAARRGETPKLRSTCVPKVPIIEPSTVQASSPPAERSWALRPMLCGSRS